MSVAVSLGEQERQQEGVVGEGRQGSTPESPLPAIQALWRHMPPYSHKAIKKKQTKTLN